MGSVRPFIKSDIPQVAVLTWKLLHRRDGLPPKTMGAYFEELFFHSPFCKSMFPSLVYQGSDGSIDGFLGVMSRPMLLCGKSIDVAISTYLAVRPESRSTMAALQLLHCFFAGKQDLAMTDSSNSASQKIWTRMGGRTAMVYTMHWSRPLRPSHYALYAVSRRFGNGSLPNAFLLGTKPICRILDALIARTPSSPFLQRSHLLAEEELTAETLLRCLHDFSELYSLRPEYDRASLSWLLNFLGRMRAFGELRKVLLRDDCGKVVGWYIYYSTEGGIGEVVQLGAMHSSMHAVLNHLSYDAWKRGAIALHGRLEPHLTDGLFERNCLFFLGNRLLVYSRNPELAQLIQTGGAFLTRLDGEWCLRFGEPQPSKHPNQVARDPYRHERPDFVPRIERLGKNGVFPQCSDD